MRFAQNYGKIVIPLTSLLNNNSFRWNVVAKQEFQALKEAMCNAPFLALFKFKKSLVLECDTSNKSIEVMSMWGLHLVFTSILLETWDNEMVVVLHIVDMWNPYLMGCYFNIKIGHYSLKYCLEQRLSSIEKQKWFTKYC